MISLKNIPTRRLTVFLVGLAFVYGCTSAEDNRAMRSNEITTMYNEYLAETSPLSEAVILSKCDQAIKEFPDLGIAYELKGLISWKGHMLRPAWDNYKKAVELTPYDEDTLANARKVALEFNGSFLKLDQNAKVMLIPFNKILLKEYTQCPEELRFKWCMISLGIEKAVTKKIIREGTTQKYVFVDPAGNEIEDMESMSFGVSFDDNSSASELDNWLFQTASAKPNSTLGEVLWLFTAKKMNFGRIR